MTNAQPQYIFSGYEIKTQKTRADLLHQTALVSEAHATGKALNAKIDTDIVTGLGKGFVMLGAEREDPIHPLPNQSNSTPVGRYGLSRRHSQGIARRLKRDYWIGAGHESQIDDEIDHCL